MRKDIAVYRPIYATWLKALRIGQGPAELHQSSRASRQTEAALAPAPRFGLPALRTLFD